MTFNKTIYFTPRKFEIGELKRSVQSLLEQAFPQGAKAHARVSRSLQDGTRHASESVDLNCLSDVCDLESEDCDVNICFYANASPSYAGHVAALFMRVHCGLISIAFGSDTSDHIVNLVERAVPLLKLERCDPPSSSSFWDELDGLRQRVVALEKERDKHIKRLSCFLSLRFEKAPIAYAEKLKAFLGLLNTDVITGQGYEPKTIQAKVAQRLDQGFDFHIMLITANGQSAWQRDEMARTQDPSVFLILLLEEGAEFERGIYGDHEYIPFPKGRIAETFLPLLEGVRYIERMRMGGP